MRSRSWLDGQRWRMRVAVGERIHSKARKWTYTWLMVTSAGDMVVGVDATNEEWRAMASSKPGGPLGGGGGVEVYAHDRHRPVVPHGCHVIFSDTALQFALDVDYNDEHRRTNPSCCASEAKARQEAKARKEAG